MWHFRNDVRNFTTVVWRRDYWTQRFLLKDKILSLRKSVMIYIA